jgi:rhamnogalacturonyl hydrolase YesR
MKRANGGPKEHHVERCICGKKKSTNAQAKKEAKYLKYNKKYPDMVPQAYKCKKSGWWHVGNSE